MNINVIDNSHPGHRVNLWWFNGNKPGKRDGIASWESLCTEDMHASSVDIEVDEYGEATALCAICQEKLTDQDNWVEAYYEANGDES